MSLPQPNHQATKNRQQKTGNKKQATKNKKQKSTVSANRIKEIRDDMYTKKLTECEILIAPLLLVYFDEGAVPHTWPDIHYIIHVCLIDK